MPIQPSIDLALGLLLVGITLFAVILYLRLQSNRLRDYLLKLYLINRQVNQDVLDFVDQAWPILEAAGFKSLQGRFNGLASGKPFSMVSPERNLTPSVLPSGESAFA